MTRRRISSLLALLAPASLALVACSDAGDGRLQVAVIEEPESFFADGVRISDAAQHLRAATAEGLVTLDKDGVLTPALADSWTVTDDGRSYIFRLRDGTWPDGSPVTAQGAVADIRRTLDALEGTTLGLDFAKVRDVRALAGRVIEFRLTSPMPDFLQLLAQGELGVVHEGEGSGPLALQRDGPAAVLSPIAPEDRGLPQERGWAGRTSAIVVRALPADKAIDWFDEGAIDLVLGGRIASLPLVDTGPLARGTVQLDGVEGMFGLRPRRAAGVLAEPELRAALSMAIDRAALMSSFNLGGWEARDTLLPIALNEELAADAQAEQGGWRALNLEARRQVAIRRVAAWKESDTARVARLSLALPEGPGSDRIVSALQADWAAICVELVRVPERTNADLIWVDRVARFDAPRWYLNQLACDASRGLCSRGVDALVAASLSPPSAAAGADALREAVARAEELELFMPLGAPVRWSLARGQVAGFAPNPYAFHPLPPLAITPR